MKSILTKKILIIVSIIAFFSIGAVILAFTTGNIHYPELSDPDGIFYQRVDDQGNVIYSITNKELFEEIKGNDGIQQLLFMTDSILLSEYISEVTQAEIDDKLLELTYGTSDADEIAEFDADQLEQLETAFAQSMILAGFQNDEDSYAKLMVAREKFVEAYAEENQVITERKVFEEYLNRYYGDISAIKIRFTSEADAKDVMRKFNLVSMANIELREYKGWVYQSETLKDPDGDIVEATISVDVYYFDEDDNILDLDDNILYELGTNGYYTDAEDKEYVIDLVTKDLIDGLAQVVIESEVLFETKEEAETYKESNSEYFTVTRTDPYDMDETIQVLDDTDTVVYTIDSDGNIFDAASNDVTDTTELYVNKVYTDIEDVTIITTNNSRELDDEEVLAKYIDMYNYVYGLYRDTLPSGADVEDLLSLNNEYLSFQYDEEFENNAAVTNYMFGDLNIEDDSFFSQAPKLIQSGSAGYYYMVYKLDETPKEPVMDKIYDYLQPLVTFPRRIATSIVLPTTTYYGGTISWTSEDTALITNTGVVTTPDEDTEVKLTYTIRVFGKTRSFTETVTILASGENDAVVEPEWEEVPLKTIMNDPSAYSYLYNKLLENYVYGDQADQTIDTVLKETRADLGFKIYDRYVGLDYQGMDATFLLDEDGDKTLFASYEKTLTSDEPLEITADEFFEFALTKNAALYTLYASQNKELLNSDYFEEIFGEQRNLQRNKSDRMEQMFQAVQSTKEYYVYLQQLYGSYGMAFNYTSFSDYAYSQYGTKTELALLEYFVVGELQPYLIDETVETYDVITELYDTVQEYYDNYFSLNVTHVLIHIDFDEDGSPDDFIDYQDSLTQAEKDAFNQLLADLEFAIDEFDGTFAELVKAFNDAPRDDETWGDFKQNGFLILTEDLNATDDDGNKHSLTYAGEYGIKDSFADGFVEALIALYDEYQIPQNLTKTELFSNLTETEFGMHLIRVTKGDDFEQPSAAFSEEDPANPEYSEGIENDDDAPTLEQMQLFALYKFYSMIYDMSNADLEEMYDIDVPEIPTVVNDALEVYFDELLSKVYVLGTINVNMSERLSDGEFIENSYTDATNAELMALLVDIEQVYFDAIFGDYIER